MTDGTPGTSRTTLVVIPTYNERESIESIVGRVRSAAPALHILITDDNSPDGTGRIADRLAAADESIHVLHRTAKEGLGAAYLAGFAWGLDKGYDVLVEMDADGSHQPEQLQRLLDALNEADLVLGSRWIPGGEVINWPPHRKLISRGGTTYARFVLGIQLRDVTGGFRAFRSSALRAITAEHIDSQGYCFQIDLAWRTVRHGFRVREVPVTFIERAHGQSKMNSKIVIEALARVTQWGLRHRYDQIVQALRR
ncbi:MAG: polyprenol monophosphomannose synthase [Actinomycetota bacterium]